MKANIFVLLRGVCSKYPCNPTTYNESLTRIWREKNDNMKNKGIDDFYIDQKEKPRY